MIKLNICCILLYTYINKNQTELLILYNIVNINKAIKNFCA